VSETPDPPRARLVGIKLDETSIARGNVNTEHEREVAIYDILDANRFTIDGRDDGPYTLKLAVIEDRLHFIVDTDPASGEHTFMLSLSPLKRVIKDYFIVCDSYYQAIRSAPPSRIQAIDMGRRGLHDEGSQILMERLAGKIPVDLDTARRPFTLICALHWQG
jgi:uncharacterized protein (UPF0262 family)